MAFVSLIHKNRYMFGSAVVVSEIYLDICQEKISLSLYCTFGRRNLFS